MINNVDNIASHLIQLGLQGKNMPPSWDGEGVSIPVCSLDGDYIGRVLPGRGLYLDMDLKAVGITKKLPFVYERSPIQWLKEVLLTGFATLGRPAGDRILESEIGAITTYDGIISARANGLGQDISVSKASITTVANAWSSLWQATGFPAAGSYTAIPGGAALNKDTTGAWSFGLSNPTSPSKKYLLTLGFSHATATNAIILTDLLVGAGGISTNSTSPQTVNSAALTRYPSGAGVMMTFEVTTALGTTSGSITITYTNQNGTGSRSTGAIPLLTSAIVYRLVSVALGPYMQLQSGDYGVRSVETVQMSAAMGAGVIALNLYVPLCFIPGIAANFYVERDSTVQIDGITELVTESGGALGCLNVYVFAQSTSTGVGNYFMRTCEG